MLLFSLICILCFSSLICQMRSVVSPPLIKTVNENNRVKLKFIVLESLDGREILIKGIVLSTSFSFFMWAQNRAVHLCYTIHFHTSLPLIPAEALCMDYWCDMIRVSWCLAQLSFVSWLKYLCGSRSPGNFSSSLSPLGLKPHLVCFEWLFSQAHS